MTGTRIAVSDLWGGLAAMLVALPAGIAFGVAVYAPLGAGSAGQGALAGMLGAAVIGVVAPLLGGTPRLVSSPCAPAAAVSSAFVLGLVPAAAPRVPSPEHVLALLTLVVVLAGILQVVYGLAGGGTLIKFIPYPVVTGYLSGVAIVIFLKQLPGLLGLPKGVPLLAGLSSPGLWRGPSVFVGLVTVAVMLVSTRLTKAVPAAILGLLSGSLAYLALASVRPELATLHQNPFVIGPLGGPGVSVLGSFPARFGSLSALGPGDLATALMPALTLSVLLSIDTLKTCVVVDALTRSRHDSNREVIAQGLANLSSALMGGIAGAGASGPTLVNVASGARTRWSGVVEGALCLVVLLALGPLVAWAPIAALSGILVVVALRMLDRGALRLLRTPSTRLDFLVIATVVVVAVLGDLIAASFAGVLLSILLFIRDQARVSVIRRKTTGDRISSRKRRLPDERAILQRDGAKTVVCQLQGSLFFGTTDQLLTRLSEDLDRCRFVILDLRLVRSVDLTGAHLLEQIEARLRDRSAELLLCGVPEALPSGQNVRAYLAQLGLVREGGCARVFPQLTDALEWAEDRLLAEAGLAAREDGPPLAFEAFGFLEGRKEETARDLLACVGERRYRAGEVVFRQGDPGRELFLVRRGSVRIELRVDEDQQHHLATLTRGDFFGDVAFLDAGTRSADAIAETDTDLFVIPRDRFDAVTEKHPRLARAFFASLARALASRLRQADAEIRGLEEA